MLKKLFNNRARAQLLANNAKAEEADAKKETSVSIRAKKIYADGTQDPERLVSYGHRNIIIHSICAPVAYLNGAFWEWYYTNQRITKWRNSSSMQKTS